jgi:hypothetical protein
MTVAEKDILQCLTELDEAAKGAGNPKPDLKSLLARLDQLTREMPQDSDPDLLHYLRRKSYERARLFLLQRC